MEPSANKSSADQPTGDLEHLFRQKFAEAEVTPRRNVWEQIDHELLVRQNESYRRRLVQQRWIAAACIMLVLAASTWAVHLNLFQHAEVAAVEKQNDAIESKTRLATSASRSTRLATAAPAAKSANGEAPLLAAVVRNPQVTIISEGGSAVSQGSSFGAANEVASLGSTYSSGVGRSYAASQQSLPTGGMFTARQAIAGGYASGFAANEASFSGGLLPGTMATRMASLLAAMTGNLPDTLRKAALPAGPEMLAAQEVLPERPRTSSKRWRWSAAVAASSYNPNINFSRNSHSALAYAYSSPSPTQNVGTADQGTMYEQAANEYRQHLQAGSGFRGKLGAARPLSKRWELVTGLEVALLTAASQFATTTAAYSPNADAFTGANATYRQQLSSNTVSFSQPSISATHYRYTSAGVPVAVRYSSPKNGLSFYATLGAAVNVLLGSRTEVAGASEATQKYSLNSSDSPYRKVLASVRGGAGARYRAADGQWSLLIGPEADLGLTTLNADPAQSFFKRSRPYSVGLATSVEFGGTKSTVVNP
ncbi:hypothetical protein [Hymenobacter sp. GOD-10R]|uniref:hypothetical protein n=1 Tax=Hymenobacter sp. GOD-10R TaxID=3093922 RepID=UPI002D78FF1C|nr:hypothetical protein [Hymenobacter sp. GOD-10R]WRQ29334.1 hypothetical protein SD425_03535 [Hymenobacter sp. GOD-10R]